MTFTIPFGSPIRKVLLPGEQLQWVGRPPGGIMLRSSDALLIPFSLMWGGGAVVWECIALGIIGRGPFNPCAGAFGIPFVIFGYYLVVGRFIRDRRRRASIYYAVTDRRVLIMLDRALPHLIGIAYAKVPSVTLLVHADGSGTLTFGQGKYDAYGGAFQNWGGPREPTFERIADPRRVEALIRRNRDNAVVAQAPRQRVEM